METEDEIFFDFPNFMKLSLDKENNTLFGYVDETENRGGEEKSDLLKNFISCLKRNGFCFSIRNSHENHKQKLFSDKTVTNSPIQRRKNILYRCSRGVKYYRTGKDRKNLHEYVNKKTRNKPSKKMNCEAYMKVDEIVFYPQYKFFATHWRAKKEVISRLKTDLEMNNGISVISIKRYYIRISLPCVHNHSKILPTPRKTKQNSSQSTEGEMFSPIEVMDHHEVEIVTIEDSSTELFIKIQSTLKSLLNLSSLISEKANPCDLERALECLQEAESLLKENRLEQNDQRDTLSDERKPESCLNLDTLSDSRRPEKVVLPEIRVDFDTLSHTRRPELRLDLCTLLDAKGPELRVRFDFDTSSETRSEPCLNPDTLLDARSEPRPSLDTLSDTRRRPEPCSVFRSPANKKIRFPDFKY